MDNNEETRCEFTKRDGERCLLPRGKDNNNEYCHSHKRCQTTCTKEECKRLVALTEQLCYACAISQTHTHQETQPARDIDTEKQQRRDAATIHDKVATHAREAKGKKALHVVSALHDAVSNLTSTQSRLSAQTREMAMLARVDEHLAEEGQKVLDAYAASRESDDISFENYYASLDVSQYMCTLGEKSNLTHLVSPTTDPDF